MHEEDRMGLYLYDEEDAPDITTGPEIVNEEAATATAVMEERGAETPANDRRGYLGGSDAAIVAGLSPWKTPYQLYLEKTGAEKSLDLSGIERVYWGTVLEEIVAREYANRSGHKIRRVNRLMKHADYPYIGAHIDRDILNTDGILEVKTAGRRDNWGEPGSGDIPDNYLAQVQHYMGVAGAQWADVAVLFFGQEMVVYHVERDDEFIDGLFAIERRFWNEHVLTGIPPTPESSEEASQMWRTTRPGTVTGNDGTLITATKLHDVRATIKEKESEKDLLEAELKRQMQDIGDTLIVGKEKVATWKNQTSRRFDSNLFGEDHPDLYDQYKTEKESRVFRFSYKPGKGGK